MLDGDKKIMIITLHFNIIVYKIYLYNYTQRTKINLIIIKL